MNARTVLSVARAGLIAVAIGVGPVPALAAQEAGAGTAPAALSGVDAAPAPASAAQPVNAKCPVMTDEDALPDHTLPWQGRTIGFCCNKCVRKFQERPGRYLANLPPLATPAVVDAATEGATEGAPGSTGSSIAPTSDSVEAPRTGDGSSAPSTPTSTPAAASGTPETRGQLELLVGRVHPMLVHFPIALLFAAALAEMMGALRGNSGSSTSARFCVALGALGAVAAAITGWQRAQAFTPLPGTESHVDIHRWLAVATAGYALLLTLVGVWARERSNQVRSSGLGLFRWGLLVGAALVAVTAHYGGTLVYGAGFPFGE